MTTLAHFHCLGMCRSLKAVLKIDVSMTNFLCGISKSMGAVILSQNRALHELIFLLVMAFIMPRLVSLIGWLLVGFTLGIRVDQASLRWNVDLR